MSVHYSAGNRTKTTASRWKRVSNVRVICMHSVQSWWSIPDSDGKNNIEMHIHADDWADKNAGTYTRWNRSCASVGILFSHRYTTLLAIKYCIPRWNSSKPRKFDENYKKKCSFWVETFWTLWKAREISPRVKNIHFSEHRSEWRSKMVLLMSITIFVPLGSCYVIQQDECH